MRLNSFYNATWTPMKGNIFEHASSHDLPQNKEQKLFHEKTPSFVRGEQINYFLINLIVTCLKLCFLELYIIMFVNVLLKPT